MAVCLQYQSVYVRRESKAVSARVQILAAVVLLGVLGARVWVKLEATDLGYQMAHERSVLLRPDSLAKSAREMAQLSEHSPGRTLKVSY
jgi:hypothetical protein